MCEDLSGKKMGQIKIPTPVYLFVGLIGREEEVFEEAKKRLIQHFGGIKAESNYFPFNLTTYYEPEMGSPLKKKFVLFTRVIKREELVKIKLLTNQLEKVFSTRGKRKINLDPGYLSLSQVVLATTKDYFHRLYLGEGIYAEVTLHYRNKTFTPFPWTYPDYQKREYIELFNQWRQFLFEGKKP
jgi:hypothetical protein